MEFYKVFWLHICFTSSASMPLFHPYMQWVFFQVLPKYSKTYSPFLNPVPTGSLSQFLLCKFLCNHVGMQLQSFKWILLICFHGPVLSVLCSLDFCFCGITMKQRNKGTAHWLCCTLLSEHYWHNGVTMGLQKQNKESVLVLYERTMEKSIKAAMYANF